MCLKNVNFGTPLRTPYGSRNVIMVNNVFEACGCEFTIQHQLKLGPD